MNTRKKHSLDLGFGSFGSSCGRLGGLDLGGPGSLGSIGILAEHIFVSLGKKKLPAQRVHILKKKNTV